MLLHYPAVCVTEKKIIIDHNLRFGSDFYDYTKYMNLQLGKVYIIKFIIYTFRVLNKFWSRRLKYKSRRLEKRVP